MRVVGLFWGWLIKRLVVVLFALAAQAVFILAHEAKAVDTPLADANGLENSQVLAAPENSESKESSKEQDAGKTKESGATAKPSSPARKSGDNSSQLFNTVELKRPLSSLPNWVKLLERNKDKPIFVKGQRFGKSMTWDEFKAGAKGKSGLALMRYVHNFWNKWPYREDSANWGLADYWAIPAEFLEKSGDCEDYAIIKYFTLKELGFPADKMRIVVLRDTVRNLAHAILAVYWDGEIYVLDNLSSAVLAHKHFKHYLPQYSVNETARWAHMRGRNIRPTKTAAGK
ncbi:MAG: transglutaminase-like cysteine peptidase [Desulfovibrionaceae bacterium]|nr:transglutaminase-like cysteine peptidase [Desulfovibrionaceae bacterium]